MSLGSVEGAGGACTGWGDLWGKQTAKAARTSGGDFGPQRGVGVRAGTYVEEQMAPSALPPLPGPGLHGPQHGRSMALALWVL